MPTNSTNPSLNNSHEIIAQMQALVPPGSPFPQDPKVLHQLQVLTQALIRTYQDAGRLHADPFEEVWERPLHLYATEVSQYLQGKTVLVTGGEGFVGHCLIQKLQHLGVRRVVSIDNLRCVTGETIEPIVDDKSNAIFYAADVRDWDTLHSIFGQESPHVVFHLAAIRIPGLAEKIVHETVTSNIFGTQNIIRLCEMFGVEQCIFSSTGKASRYWTGEVYAATKKMNEWLFAHAAQHGQVRYGMVRFTHMLNNSAMCEYIDRKVAAVEPIAIHAPERYVVGQNVGEAVHLLLNALVFSQPDRLRFLLVRNLGWPTESLEVALYKILQSGDDIPVYFQGIPPGYEESFFLGQVDWDRQMEINTLVNTLETRAFSEITNSGDMILSEVVPFDQSLLLERVAQLRQLCADPTIDPAVIKQSLADAVYAIALTAFKQAPVKRIVQVLKWGMNLKHYERGEFNLAAYLPFVELAVQSICDRLHMEDLAAGQVSMAEFGRMLVALDTLPSLQSEVRQLRQRSTTPMVGAVVVAEPVVA